MVFLPNLGLNRRDRLGGITEYASAQSFDFLDLGQKSSFLNWKRRKVPIFKKTINGWALFNSVRLGDQLIIGDQIDSAELSGIYLFVKNAIKKMIYPQENPSKIV